MMGSDGWIVKPRNNADSFPYSMHFRLKKCPVQSVNHKQGELNELWGDVISMRIFRVFSLFRQKYVNFKP